jgi:hypothetical protein
MTLAPNLKDALDTITRALGSEPVPAPAWFDPTPTETAAFSVAHGIPLADVLGYTGTGENTAQTKITPLVNPTDEELLVYGKFGYRANGSRWVWTRYDLALNRAYFCAGIARAESPDQADAVISGAGLVTQLVAEYLVMGGAIVNSTPFASPRLQTGTLNGDSTLADASAFLTGSGSTPGGQ